MRRNRLILLLIAALVTSVAFSQSRPTMAVGHAGDVNDLAGRADLDFGFSAGNDGKLIVWDLRSDAMYASFQIAVDPITSIALHPTETIVAAFVQESVNQGRIIALDWVSGDRIFETAVDGRPTTMSYSPSAAYLVASLDSFESLLILDGTTGRPTGALDDGFGVVSFVQIAPNEQNVVTYVPSRGELIYWSIRSGRELQTVQTASRLRHMVLIDPENFRFLAAAAENEIVVVDNLSGNVVSTYPARPIEDIVFDPSTGRILALSELNGRSNVLAFEFRGGRIRRASYRPQGLNNETAVIGVAGTTSPGRMLSGGENGSVAVADGRTGRNTSLGAGQTVRATGVAFADDSLLVASGSRILQIQSDLFEDRSTGSIRTSWIEGDGSIGMAVGEDALFTWDSSEPGTIWLETGAEREVLYDDPDDAPIASARETDAGILVLHRDGRVVFVSEENTSVGYQGRGLQDAVWSESLGLVAAKSRTTTFDSSVILVDQVTRETVAAATDAFLTTRLALDDDGETVFAIGLVGDRPDVETRLLRLSGRGLRRSETLVRHPGEAPQADLVWESERGSVLTTLTEGTIQRITGRSVATFEQIERIPVDLAANEAFVASANADGTVSLWNADDRSHLVDIYVFDDAWLAIAPNGAFYASSRTAERYLSFLSAPGSRLRTADFRVTLPFRIP